MHHRAFVLFALLLLASPLRLRAGDDDGWERFDAVPTWVTDPPARPGYVTAVDVGLSNRLSLAYDPERVPREVLNLHASVERRLRRLLGENAGEPALAGAAAATVVRKGYHHHRSGKPRAVGSNVYACFVQWETPVDAILAEVPETQREAARVLLRARLPAVAWQAVEHEPAWVRAPPSKDGVYVAVAEEGSSRADVARATADLRGTDHVRYEIHSRLRFQVGPDRARRAAVDAVSHATVTRRAWAAAPARAWMLVEVPVDRILAHIPETSRDEAARALTRPAPPRPWTYVEVSAEPPWVAAPPRWPDHVPYVQTVEGVLAEVVKKQTARGAELEIREELERRLRPLVGPQAAAEAAHAGARGRAMGAHALRERASGPGTHRVTTWALWQIPIADVLAPLGPEHHAMVRQALRP